MSARTWMLARLTGAQVSQERAVRELDAYRAEVIAERDAQTVEWLTKKAGEFGRSNRDARAASDAVARMADKLARGAVRDDETGLSELYRLRSENGRLRSEARQLQNDITGACLARYEEEQENARLREERHSTNEALDDAVRELRAQRDRIAELPDRLVAVLTERFTELGNPFSEMRTQFQGPDGWPASKLVGPKGVAEVLRELLSEPTVGRDLPEVTPVESGSCSECGQAPSEWCSGCAACRCADGHDAGCPYGECPSCAAPADATGTRIPSHRTGCPREVTP
ncbi:hypothetical protein ACFUIZ_18795 [Streptomyces cinereoruber]|uniref:hypothetical protein n=1 Tax=Streptomyces cinereoruber TaxID=67260 RepID=UPI003624EE70